MKIYTNAVFGYECPLVEIETDLRKGSSVVDIVGLADNAVKETRQRIKSAFLNCGLEFPEGKVLMSLSPYDLKKEGGRFDLPMALSVLAEHNKDRLKDIQVFALGELKLCGDIRYVNAVGAGVLSAKRNGIEYAVLPIGTEENIPDGMKVYYATSLTDAYFALMSIGTEKEIGFFKEIKNIEITDEIEFAETTDKTDLDKLVPTEKHKDSWYFLKYAMAVAVAGHHNIITSGMPGCGKTLLMQYIPSLLPKLTKSEMQTNDRIYSIAGLAGKYLSRRQRPFRQPHQTASIESMSGGGFNCRPGEIALANNGVLFLDEAAEFRTTVLQLLRVPLENRKITLSRAGRFTVFPANFLLAMAVNPCPCGNFGAKDKICLCSQHAIELYWKKFSAPLLSKIAIRIDMNNAPKNFPNHSQDELRAKIKIAWEKQFSRDKCFCNDLQDKSCLNEITEKAKLLFCQQKEQYKLTNGQAEYILKLARTVADMEEHSEIYLEDIAMALTLNLGLEEIKNLSLIEC